MTVSNKYIITQDPKIKINLNASNNIPKPAAKPLL